MRLVWFSAGSCGCSSLWRSGSRAPAFKRWADGAHSGEERAEEQPAGRAQTEHDGGEDGGGERLACAEAKPEKPLVLKFEVPTAM